MTRRDVVLLIALCAVVYATGLATHGVTNWQEGQRLVVAREMQQRGEWLVPTINGKPYLAKPPMIYWCQRAAARATGGEVGLYGLRLTVALAGMLGVVGTYFTARRILGSHDPPLPHCSPDVAGERDTRREWARESALWAAVMLATGVLYVRSSRIGELDILLVPFVVVSVGAVFAAWEHARARRREHWGWIALATAAAIGAAMTKGPPGVLVIALAGYGGIALWGAFTGERLDVRPFRPAPPERDVEARTAPAWVNVAGFAAGFLLAGGAGALHADAAGDAPGVVLLGACGGVVGLVASRLVLRRERGMAVFTVWSRTHPVIVLGAPMGAVWWWGKVVAGRVGEAAAMGLAAEEAGDNLRLLAPESPLVNLGAAGYGVGMASVAAIAAVVWLVKDRPRWGLGWWVVAAWVGLGLVAFSMLGKGVARYLTPVWPGIAMLGGMFVATWVRDARRPGVVRGWLGACVAALALGQAWWYGYGREVYEGERSPRALVMEVLQEGYGINAERLVTFEFRTPAVDYYAGRWVQHVGETGLRAGIAGGEAWEMHEFVERVRESGEVWGVLVRKEAREGEEHAPAERLTRAGLAVQEVPAASRFVIDGGRSEVGVVRVWWP